MLTIQTRLTCQWYWRALFFVLFLAVLAGLVSRWSAIALWAGALVVLALCVVVLVRGAIWRAKGGAESSARVRVSQFVARHAQWNLRIYRTPAGLRLMATQRTFDPGEPAVAEFFKAVGADRVYARMCLNQQCFRARLSAKPWRIGIEEQLKPRPGVWPVAAERLPGRTAWIARYEAKASAYAAGRYIESLGNGVVDAAVRPTVELHDELSGAASSRPIA
jgi:hypothetical protein